MKEKKNVELGVKYPGYGVLNEYGEWTFTPSQVGSRKGRKKFVCGDTDYTVYTTKKKVIIHLSMNRDTCFNLIQYFTKIVNRLLLVFKDYDFRHIQSDKN